MNLSARIAQKHLAAKKPEYGPVTPYEDWLDNNPEFAKASTVAPFLMRKLVMGLKLRAMPAAMRFFQIVDQVYHMSLGAPVEDLSQEFRAAAKFLSQAVIRSLGDEKGASLANSITDCAVDNAALLRRIAAGAKGVVFTNFGVSVAEVVQGLSREVGLSAGYQVKTVEGTRWPLVRVLSKDEAGLRSLQENNPDLYTEIVGNIEQAGKFQAQVEKAVIENGLVPTTVTHQGVPLPASEDYVTKEKTVYTPDGRVLPEAEFRRDNMMKARSEAMLTDEFAPMYVMNSKGQPEAVRRPDQLKVAGLTKLSDEDLNNPEMIPLGADGNPQEVEFRAMTDDKAAAGKQNTRIYPTRRDIYGNLVIVDGRFKGFYLDDMVNQKGRLVEGAAYDIRTDGIPVAFDTLEADGSLRLSSVNKEPYVTLNSEGKFLIKIPFVGGGRGTKDPFKRARDAMAARASIPEKVKWVKGPDGKRTKEKTPGRTRTTIFEVPKIRDDEDSNTLFTFEVQDFNTVRTAVGGMCLSAEAAKKIRDYFNQQARVEESTRQENTKSYSLDRIGGFKTQLVINPETGEPYDPPKLTKDLLSKQKEALSWIEAKGYKGLAALDTGVGKCPRYDTLIPTNRGMVQIKDINPGLTEPDTQAPVDGWSVVTGGETLPVKAFYYAGTKPSIKVKTRSGYEIEGSLIHPVLTRGRQGENFTKLPDLKLGDYLCIERRDGGFPTEEPSLRVPVAVNGSKTYNVPDRMNPELARLLGYIVAEGWVNNRNFFTISQDGALNPEVNSDIVRLCRSQFGYTVDPTENDKGITSTFLRTYLEWMGVDYTLSADKCIPPVVLQSTRESLVSFIRAYVDADGSVCDNGLEVSSASERLLRELQVVLLRFGVVSSRSPKKVAERDHTYWRLSITGDALRLYRNAVGMVSSRKAAMVDVLCERSANSNTDITPHAVDLVENLRSEIFLRAGGLGKGGGLNKRFGNAFVHTLTHIRQGRRNPTYAFMRGMITVAETVGAADTMAYRAMVSHVTNRYFYDPIVSITPGFTELMDIMVDDPRHTFIGNGVVNHNTLLTIATMQKMVRDGAAGEGSRFLYVCPNHLRGNFPRELQTWMTEDAAKGLQSRVDVMSYEDFQFAVNGGKRPMKQKVPGTEKMEKIIDPVTGKPQRGPDGKLLYRPIPGTEKEVGVKDANGKRVYETVTPDPELSKKYAAVFFDEAHILVKDENNKFSVAAQKFDHPRKVLLTASPMEDDPDELYIGIAITNNVRLSKKATGDSGSRTLTPAQKELMAFRRRFVDRKAGRAMGIKDDPKNDPTKRQDFDAWVKNGMYFADKRTIGAPGTSDYEQSLKLPNLLKQDSVSLTMEPEVEIEYRKAAKGMAKLLKLMSKVFRDKASVSTADAAVVARFETEFRKYRKQLDMLANYPDEVIDPATGKKKFPGAVSSKVVGATWIVHDKIEVGKRTLLFTDDEKFAVKTAETMSNHTPNFSVAVALKGKIVSYRGGEVYNKEGSGKQVFTPREYTNLKGETVPKAEWASHVLSEIIGGDPSVGALILTSSYALGQNLQMFSTVVHLDRDNFSNETMKQRTARAWRTGQKEPVEEYTMDTVYDDPTGKSDPTLDEARKYIQEIQEDVFNEIVHKSREAELGTEWASMKETSASMVGVNRKLFEMSLAPFVSSVAEHTYNQAVTNQSASST